MLSQFIFPLRGLTPPQRNAFLAAFLGWALDAFDFFILVYVLHDIALHFGVTDERVTHAIGLTLAMRPLGAAVFGFMADRFGRKPTLMINVLFYSLMEVLSGFAPTLTALLVFRALYGIGMGGEWGVGASLAMETVPVERRGLLSGLLQEGYPVGNMMAALAYGLLFPYLGWRGMFFLGLVPAPFVFLIRSHVEESAAWHMSQDSGVPVAEVLRRNWLVLAYLVLLMSAFNFMSHGTQDLYPTLLKVQLGFDPHMILLVSMAGNVGAVLGGMMFGALSERWGRRRTIATAALLGLPVIPLWAFSATLPMLALGAFLMQLMVQGAWGVIPAHLNELSPDAIRGTAPGVTYQLGNLLASYCSIMQAQLAQRWGTTGHPNYSSSLAVVIAGVLVVVAIVSALGHERKGVVFGEAA